MLFFHVRIYGNSSVGQRKRSNSLDQLVDFLPTGSIILFHNAFATEIQTRIIIIYYILSGVTKKLMTTPCNVFLSTDYLYLINGLSLNYLVKNLLVSITIIFHTLYMF